MGEKGGVQFASEWDQREEDEPDQHDILWELLDKADVVITYNGDKFDLPIVNREFLTRGYLPPSPYFSVDLYRTVKRKFRFLYNKMDYVCRELGIGRKVKHEGFELWTKVMDGDAKARAKMERYNKQDVRLLEPLYKHLLPWIDTHPNHALYVDTNEPVCPNCGSKHLHKKGVQRTQTQIYQRYSCQSCGKPSRSRTTLVPPDKRATILAGVKT
jgi:predicted RNA-binding Zn-ribbon protein involved in translation (DUF1610 family)